MMEKTYDPAAIEDRIAKAWEEGGAFRAGRPERQAAEPYCIVIPPPNVTGSLHMGHALNNTLQDILCRFERMRGKDVLWQPGTDHAGIATQMVVERQMMERQEPGRREIGREAFLKKVWAWKEESGGTIVRQLKRIGASCDWSRERFTMDEGLSAAVADFFVALNEAGLVYKDKRLVNWDPKLLTAISDLEVEQVEVKGHLWHLAYPLEDGSGTITVATTRPETMLGDTAIAVHPEDERYRHLIGRFAILPLVGRKIPIVGDTYSDPEKGTGAVKITPGHDFNDFEVGKRHDLEIVNILTADARLIDAEPVPAKYRGLERFAARKAIVADLEEAGVLVQIEPHTHMVPHGDRSGVVIEPWLTDQWYVDVKPLAERALSAVRDGKTRFVPENYQKVFFDWLEKIEPWCVSRQLWWGHQIPAWYGPDGSYVVARSETEARSLADAKWGADAPIERDQDVLDTWFSSALWPFSTLGWPAKSPELARYYPNNALVTGFDIIFFWVARMMMAGLFTQDEVPFRDVYIHGLVRDAKGAKMSKSKGNVIDPLSIIDQHGADALRFALAASATQGRDLKLSTQRIEGYRNFCNKIWQAFRFAELNGCARDPGFAPAAVSEALNRWILAEAGKAVEEVTTAILDYRFNEAATAAYRFTWNTVCDWYLELAKPLLQGADGAGKTETRATVAHVLDVIVKLLHPFMPFVTEELWTVSGGQGLLALAEWPAGGAGAADEAEAEIGMVIDLIGEIRSARSEMNVPVAAQVPLVLVSASEATQVWARRWEDMLKRLARLSGIEFAAMPPAQSVQMVVRGQLASLPLAGIIDFDVERVRLGKEVERLGGEISRFEGKLGNADFVARAPEEVVDEQREKLADARERRAKLAEALTRLG